MKKLMSGNEAIAQGAWEAGVLFAAGYPGTPSTEVLEVLATYDEIDAHWSSNETAVVYTGVAGLLNLLIILDALSRADVVPARARRATRSGAGVRKGAR